jgi:hypothetical protein
MKGIGSSVQKRVNGARDCSEKSEMGLGWVDGIWFYGFMGV